MGVQLRDRHRRRVGGKGCLRERIDLRSVEVIAEKGIFVGRQVDSVRVSAQVRVVTDAGVGVRRRKRRRYDAKRWNSSASVVWGAEVAIVLNVYAIYGPCRGGRIATVADRKVKVVLTGDFTGQNHLDLAVSNGGDPTTATWTVYRVDVQDDGNLGTPDHGCTGIPPFGVIPPTFPPTYTDACIGDYPHLGADANGIYLTTNEYSFFGNDFHGAQIYAFSKAALAANAATVSVTQLDTHGMDAGNSGFTIWPATSPAGQSSSANGGTEYFLSSNAADEAHGNGASVGPRRSNQLLVWSLTHTSTLDATLNLSLSHSTLTVGLYVVPAFSEQKVGSTPLIACLNKHACATSIFGARDPFAPEHEAAIDSNDTRMQQVVFANGRLWGALDTAVNSSANTRAGIEWFVVNPVGAGSIVKRGYLAVSQNNVTYPAIAVTSNGKGVMAFTLVGRDFHPSAAFVSIDANGVGPVQVAAMGLGPDDGFTGTVGLTAPFPFRPRWGDYGAAAVEGAHIWIGSEYIGQTCTLRTFIATAASCGGTRTLLGNWDTRITEVNTGS